MPFPDVVIEPVRSKRERRDFILFAWKVYAGDPNWVAPLISDAMKLHDPAQHPFHQHAEVELFVARRGGARAESLAGAGPAVGRPGEVIGRIAAIVNHTHNEFHGEKTGFFGFFECLPDQGVASLLLETAADWLRGRGMETMRGPANYSSNEEWGLLIDGFDSAPFIMMTYNPPRYADHFEAFGLRKAKDLVAHILEDNRPPERFARSVDRVVEKSGVKIRPLDMKHFDREVELVQTLYNSIWEKNWGFVPMSAAEIAHMARELKPVVDPALVLFAELKGEVVGFALAVPNANQALQKANGRLFPFGLVKMMLEMRKVHWARVLTLGIVPSHRGQGLDAALYLGMYRAAAGRGYIGGEFSWILEDNLPIRRGLEHFGARVYKTYRVYDYALAR